MTTKEAYNMRRPLSSTIINVRKTDKTRDMCYLPEGSCVASLLETIGEAKPGSTSAFQPHGSSLLDCELACAWTNSITRFLTRKLRNARRSGGTIRACY